MEYKEENNRFVAFDKNGKEAGEVTFQNAGDTMIIIDHTFVDDDYRGQGIGAELVRYVVDKAKNTDKKIVPLCPFAQREFIRKPEYQEFKAGNIKQE